MTHNINAERVTLQIRRGTLIALLLLLDATSDNFLKAAEESVIQEDEARNRKQALKYDAIHDELKDQLVKHEDKAKLKGWRV